MNDIWMIYEWYIYIYSDCVWIQNIFFLIYTWSRQVKELQSVTSKQKPQNLNQPYQPQTISITVLSSDMNDMQSIMNDGIALTLEQQQAVRNSATQALLKVLMFYSILFYFILYIIYIHIYIYIYIYIAMLQRFLQNNMNIFIKM